MEVNEFKTKPIDSLFDIRHLPKNIQDQIDTKSIIIKINEIGVSDIIITHWYLPTPMINSSQLCEDMISSRITKEDYGEIYKMSKLALMAYSMPYTLERMFLKFHLSNMLFSRYFQTYISESIYMSFNNMHRILNREQSIIPISPYSQMGGFYIRTPTQIYKKNKERLYNLTSKDLHGELLNKFICGNMNVYILKEFLNKKKDYQLHILFRGTTNPFNGIPQYGKSMSNTQIFRYPQYEPLENKFYEGGSEKVALFYYYYMELLFNIEQHLLYFLDVLNWESKKCSKILVCGHSMGAAITLMVCYWFKRKYPILWKKMYFRTLGSPMCCNAEAVRVIEEDIANSNQTNKFIDVLNDDDILCAKYMMGKKESLEESIKLGTQHLLQWLLQEYLKTNGIRKMKEKNTTEKIIKYIEQNSEVAISIFLSGMMKSQSSSYICDKREAQRLGQRGDERKFWNTSQLSKLYNNTLRIIRCSRTVEGLNEYVGRSHSKYMDLSFNNVWSSTKMFENELFNKLKTTGLSKDDDVIVVAIVCEDEMKQAKKIIRHYKPKPYVSPLMEHINTIIESQSKEPNINEED